MQAALLVGKTREILESIPGKILKRNKFLRHATSLIVKSLPPQQQVQDLANLSLKLSRWDPFQHLSIQNPAEPTFFQSYSLLHFCKFTSVYFFCSKLANRHSICKYFGTNKVRSQEFTRQVFSYYYFYPAQSHGFSCTNTHTGDPSIKLTQLCSCVEPITVEKWTVGSTVEK